MYPVPVWDMQLKTFEQTRAERLAGTGQVLRPKVS
jgi:hypothetical protein